MLRWIAIAALVLLAAVIMVRGWWRCRRDRWAEADEHEENWRDRIG